MPDSKPSMILKPRPFVLNWVVALAFIMWSAGGLAQTDGPPSQPGVSGNVSNSVDADLFVVDKWQTADGLLRNDVRAITQTKDGYLWIGTSAGVSRFDGIRFTHFTVANTPSMAGYTIQCMFEDSRSRLWIGTAEGELTYHHQGRFTKVVKPSKGEINCITEDHLGRIWIGAGNGLCLVEAHEVRVFQIQGLISSRPVRRLVFDPIQQVLWFDQDGLLKYLSGDQHGAPFSADGRNNVFVNTILPSPGGGLEIITDQRQRVRMRSLDQAEEAESMPVPSHEWSHCAMFDSEGSMWLGMNELGLYRFSNDDSVLHLTKTDGLSDDAISSICQDREGSMWVGTRSGGLIRLRKRVAHVFSKFSGIEGESVNAMTPYVEGIGVLAATRSQSVYHLGDHVTHLVNLPAADVLFQDAERRLWINFFSGALSAHTRQGGIYLESARNVSELFNRSTAMMQDRSGVLWFGGHFGLGNYVDGHFREIKVVHDKISGMNVSVSSLADSVKNHIWVGSSRNGLFVLDRDTLNFRPFPALPEGDYIRSLYEDSKGTLWAGTYGRGLWRVNQNGATLFTERDGLPNAFITGITEDDDGNIWFGTHRGIVRLRTDVSSEDVEPNSRDVWFTVFGKSDGLISEECVGDWQPNVCKTKDGRIWFATVRGAAVMDPRNVAEPLVAPPVMIEELVTNDGQVFLPDHGDASEGEMVLPKGVQRFDLHFTALTFISPAQCQFQFQLEGYDGEWSRPTTDRSAQFANVPPGRYRFRVRASNHHGHWNRAGNSVVIVVTPHVWETRWFRYMVLLMGLGLLVVVVRYSSTQVLKRRLEREEQQRMLEKERTRIARDMHDRLGAQLTRINLLTELADKEESRTGSSGGHLSSIAQATRDLMLKMDQVVWAVNPLKDSVAELIGYCTDYAEQFLESTAIACRVSMPDVPPDIQVSSNMRYQFLLVLGETLNNVVRHAEATEVRLAWSMDASHLTLVVEDNGVGFDAQSSTIRRSGLTNMKERMTSIGGRFLLTSQPGKGTLVFLSIDRSAIQ